MCAEDGAAIGAAELVVGAAQGTDAVQQVQDRLPGHTNTLRNAKLEC